MPTPEHIPNIPCPSTGGSSASGTPTPSPCPQHGSNGTSTQPAESSSSSPKRTIPSPSEPSGVHQPVPRYQSIPLSQIQVDDDLNGRLAMDQDRIAELAKEIARDGLIHPITVAPVGDEYVLIAGRRRLAAAEKLRWPEIYATVLEADDTKIATIRFLENATRSDLSPVEEAKQLAAMLEDGTGDVEDLARRINRRAEWVLDRLEMIDWPEELMYAVHHKTISLGAAQRLSRIQPDTLRKTRIEFAKLHGINIRTAQLWLQDSQSDFSTPENAPLNCMIYAPKAISTETRFHCFFCREAFPLENTVPLRICSQCLSTVQHEQNRPRTDLHQDAPTPQQHHQPPTQQHQAMLGPYEQYPGDNDIPDTKAHHMNQHHPDHKSRHPT